MSTEVGIIVLVWAFLFIIQTINLAEKKIEAIISPPQAKPANFDQNYAYF